ncbi:MAG: AAA family ATPase [Candidatus Micrarchaeota archaeon]
MIIERPNEVKRIIETRKWCFVYGRRKTGKSYLVENFTPYDDYFFVKRDRTVISKKSSKTISHDAFLEVLDHELANGKTVVVDEFQRLGEDFLDVLHASKKQGKLVLISSTLFLSKRLLGGKSPLLGFFSEVPVRLISMEDTLRKLAGYGISRKQMVELAILLREPIAVDYFDEKAAPREMFAKIIEGSMRTIPALVGEIFLEEERGMSAVYEAVLRAVASGKVVSSEISSYLFSRRLIAKDDPSVIQQYLRNLAEFGIIRKIAVYNRNKFIYRHTSPLLRLFYYADEKYNISERTMSETEIGRIIDELIPRIVEDEIREFMASKTGLSEAMMETEGYDIDVCLLRFRKPEIAIEIKWKKVDWVDIAKAEKNLGKVCVKERILFVPDKDDVKEKTQLKIVDISDFIS